MTAELDKPVFIRQRPQRDTLEVLYLVGRAGFEPATNWLKATHLSYYKALFLIKFSCNTSPQLR